jgi:ABC-2 type transport system permease protein
VTSFVRVFFIGGLIAYRALFNWIRPAVYIPTMLIGPLFQILFFAYLGRYSGLENDAFFVVGNAVQSSAMSSVFAGTMAIANERQFQTLSPLLASPANRFAVFMGRSLPVIVSGLFVSAWGFVMGRLLLHFHPPVSSIPALALVTFVSVISGTAFGLTIGSVGMRARDVFMSANVAYYIMWLLCR